MTRPDTPPPAPPPAPPTAGASGGPPAAQPAAPAPARTPGWIRLALVASLAANLLVVGVIAGALIGRQSRDAGAMPRDPISGLFLHAMPEREREALGRDLRRQAGAHGHDRAAMRAELAATLALLRGEPFDAAALAARIAGERDRQLARVGLGDRLFVERIAAMSPGERRAYADRLEEFLRRFERRTDD